MRRYTQASLAVIGLAMSPQISLAQAFVYNGEGGDAIVLTFSAPNGSITNNATMGGVRASGYCMDPLVGGVCPDAPAGERPEGWVAENNPYAYDVDTITNNGQIIGQSPILLVESLNAFTNNGTVTSTDDNFPAVYVGKGLNTFINTDAINGRVVVGGRVGSFTNSGTITNTSTASGPQGLTFNSFTMPTYMAETTVHLGQGVDSFTNSGTISGPIGVVFEGNTGSVLINSGTITGTKDFGIPVGSPVNNGSVAIVFGDGDDTLKILTGSQINGAVLFQGGTDTFDFSEFGGSATLDVEGLYGETLIAGNKLYAWTGQNRIAITQRPSTSSIGHVSNNITSEINNVIVEQIAAVDVGDVGAPDLEVADGDLLGYAPTQQKSDGETAVLSLLDTGHGPQPKPTKWWAKLFGGFSRDTTPTDVRSLFGGGLTGGHTQLDARTIAGGFVGVAGSDINAGGTQRLKAVTGVAGLYAHHDVDFASIDVSLMGGFSGHDSKRDITVIGGAETASANFTSWFVSPSLGIKVPVLEMEGGEVSVKSNISYTGGQVAGYTETGSSQNLTVGKTPLGVLSGKLGFEGAFELMHTPNGTVMLTGSIGGLVQSNLGGSTTPISVGGTTLNSVTPGQTSYGLYAGAGLKAPISDSTKLGIGLDVQGRDDGFYSATGSASVTGAF